MVVEDIMRLTSHFGSSNIPGLVARLHSWFVELQIVIRYEWVSL